MSTPKKQSNNQTVPLQAVKAAVKQATKSEQDKKVDTYVEAITGMGLSPEMESHVRPIQEVLADNVILQSRNNFLTQNNPVLPLIARPRTQAEEYVAKFQNDNIDYRNRVRHDIREKVADGWTVSNGKGVSVPTGGGGMNSVVPLELVSPDGKEKIRLDEDYNKKVAALPRHITDAADNILNTALFTILTGGAGALSRASYIPRTLGYLGFAESLSGASNQVYKDYTGSPNGYMHDLATAIGGGYENPVADAILMPFDPAYWVNPYSIGRGLVGAGSKLYNASRQMARPYLISREMNQAVRTARPLVTEVQNPLHYRTRLGEVEIDDPFNNYRMLKPGGTDNFIRRGNQFAPDYSYKKGGIWNRVRANMDNPMYARGKLWYGVEGTNKRPGLLVTRQPMYVASSHSKPFPRLDETNLNTKWGTRRVPVDEGTQNLENTGVYSWDPNYYGNGQGGYVRVRGDRPMMALYERPKSAITDAERAGIPRGDRNNKVPFLEGAASNVPEDIVLINRAKNPYIFENGRIVWNNIPTHDIDGNLLGKRITHHFTLDAPVTAHSGGDWDLAENTMIVPYRHAVEMNGHPINVEPMDTYFGGFGRFTLDQNKVKILTANPKLYRQYKLQGIDVEFSPESAALIEKANKIKTKLEPLYDKNFTPGYKMSDEEISMMIDLERQLQEVEQQNYSLVQKWTEANSRRPTMDDIKLIEAESGLPTNAHPKNPYGIRMTSNPHIDYYSTPPTHSYDFVQAIETGMPQPTWNVDDPELSRNLISITRRKLFEAAARRYPHLFGVTKQKQGGRIKLVNKHK